MLLPEVVDKYADIYMEYIREIAIVYKRVKIAYTKYVCILKCRGCIYYVCYETKNVAANFWDQFFFQIHIFAFPGQSVCGLVCVAISIKQMCVKVIIGLEGFCILPINYTSAYYTVSLFLLLLDHYIFRCVTSMQLNEHPVSFKTISPLVKTNSFCHYDVFGFVFKNL